MTDLDLNREMLTLGRVFGGKFDCGGNDALLGIAELLVAKNAAAVPGRELLKAVIYLM